MRNTVCILLILSFAFLPVALVGAEEKEILEAARLTEAECRMWTAEISPEQMNVFAFTTWLYRADLNRDGIPELYGNGSMGSGIVSLYLSGYDPVTKERYLLNERMAYDYFFTLYQETLYAVRLRSFMHVKGEGDDEASPRVYMPVLREGEGAFDLEPVEEALEAEMLDAARDAEGSLHSSWGW